MFLLAGILLAISGAAALTYQVVWVRLLSLLFGSSSESVGTVLAAFFLGLALGSAGASRLSRGRNPLAVYAGLELLVGAWGLLLLAVLPHLTAILANLGATHLTAKFALAALVLLPPTMAMGATLPLLASAVIRTRAMMGRGLGALYAMNTAGALGGALLSGFVLIPRHGLDGATYAAAALNAIVAALAWARRKGAGEPDESAPPARIVAARRAALVVLFATGFVSIAAEVGWTKYLVIFTGGTVFGYSLILSVFLAGIALGSWASRWLLPRVVSPERWLAAGVIALAFSLLLTRQLLTWMPTALASLNQAEQIAEVRLLQQVILLGGALLLPTLLFGAVFPLTLAVYCHDVEGLRHRLGRAYALNTVASVAGSLAAGFWIVPRFGTDVLLASLGAAMALVGALGLGPMLAGRWRWGLWAGAAGALLYAGGGPKLRYEPLIAAVDYVYAGQRVDRSHSPQFLFLREGRSGVVSVATDDGNTVRLQNNGLVESILDRDHPDEHARPETLLGIVPWLLHPQPRAAFVVGFGGGSTVRALERTNLESIHVVELEPAVVQAVLAVFEPKPAGLTDPRLRLEIHDARHRLLLADATYDIIVSQPSHPWLAGASALFTREFFQIVRSRLAQDGIGAQWINLFNMDTTTLLSIGKAFFEVFPHGFTLAPQPAGDLILIGSTKAIGISASDVDLRIATLGTEAEAGGLTDAIDLVGIFALSRGQWLTLAERVEANTDLNILSETRLASLDLRRYAKLPPQDDPYVLLDENQSFDLASLVLGWTRAQALDRLATRWIETDERVRARRALEQLELEDSQRAQVLRAGLDAGARIQQQDP